MAEEALPNNETIRDELARLIDSEALRRAPSHVRLLRYLVEKRVTGDAVALRETSIALEVFRRDPSAYDPRTDPIVRVSIGRLRERLETHYSHYDAPPKVRIVLPRGSYAPEFVPIAAVEPVAPGIAVLRTRNVSGVLGAGPPDNVTALSLETMEILRKAGADVNARITDVTSLTARIARTNTMTDRQGQTALFLAAATGRTEVVRYLIEHGARTDLKDDAGKTALDLLQGRGEGGRTDDARTKEIVALFQGAGSASK